MNFFLFIFFTSFFASTLFAGDKGTVQVENKDVEAVFIKANEAYQVHKFDDALALYKKIPSRSSLVYYNMGNAAYQLKKFGYALLYWRRAQDGISLALKSDLFEKIDHLKEQIGGKVHLSFPMKLLVRVRDYKLMFIKSLPMWVIQIIFLALWFFLFIFLHYLYKKRYTMLIAILFMLIALCGVILIIKYSYDKGKWAVVVAQTASLYAGPDVSFPSMGSLPEASEVTIKKEADNFYKIKAHGRVGWIEKKCVRKI